MKYCRNCGQEMDDNAAVCPRCGASTNGEYVVHEETPATSKKSNLNEVLYLIAFILCLITTIGCAIALIPLIWMVPLTMATYKAYKGERNISTGMAICILLFVNTISGILILVAENVK